MKLSDKGFELLVLALIVVSLHMLTTGFVSAALASWAGVGAEAVRLAVVLQLLSDAVILIALVLLWLVGGLFSFGRCLYRWRKGERDPQQAEVSRDGEQ
ncbi:TPA: hypothetical protein P9G65_005527 [Pseudomonas aeruginosa]|nr:hypothetical protein [Pseudomonas aeruginosa]HDQ4723239.1 hypothetical protein [Pseudomonas aeruginosa]